MMLFIYFNFLQIFASLESDIYDYIVVGASPSGSMVATELAKNGYSTLLIEAGPDLSNWNTTVPGFSIRSWDDENLNWDFRANYFDESRQLRQDMVYPRASAIGGCSLHNALIHIYPNSGDFEKLVSLTGDNSWREATFRKYFESIKLKGRQPDISKNDRRFLPLNKDLLGGISALDYKYLGLGTQILEPIIKNALGFDINGSKSNGKPNTDVPNKFFIPSNIDTDQLPPVRRGVREYVKSQLDNGSKLSVWTDSLVTKIILENDSAKGVEYIHGEHIYRASPIAKRTNQPIPQVRSVYARKEVIVSAGAFNTPQIMMLSGIGDPAHLVQMGIQPLINLPGVGKNLQDHHELSVTVQFNEDWKILENCYFTTNDNDNCFQQYKRGTGAYTKTGTLFGATFKTDSKLPYPDMWYYAVLSKFTGYFTGTAQSIADSKKHMTFVVLNPYPTLNNGIVKLKSNDPRDTPYINFHYFEEGSEKDIDRLVWGVKKARQDIRALGLISEEIIPGPKIKSDQQLKAYALNNTFGHHPCCTMKIGKNDDPMAVLDGNFKVRGVKNLRVVDQSAIPSIMGNFPVLFSYLLGLKAADAILNS